MDLNNRIKGFINNTGNTAFQSGVADCNTQMIKYANDLWPVGSDIFVAGCERYELDVFRNDKITDSLHLSVNQKVAVANVYTTTATYIRTLNYLGDNYIHINKYNETPVVRKMERSNDGTFSFTSITTPTFAAGNQVLYSNDCVLLDDDNALVGWCTSATPYHNIWKRTGSNITRITTNLTATTYGSLTFSKDGTYVAVGWSTSPFVRVAKFNGSSYVALTIPTARDDGDAIKFVGENSEILLYSPPTTPFINAYTRVGDTFTRQDSIVDVAPSAFVTRFEYKSGYMYAGANGGAVYIYRLNTSTNSFNYVTALATGRTGACTQIKVLEFSESDKYLLVSYYANNTKIMCWKIEGETYTYMGELPVNLGLTSSYAGFDVWIRNYT